MNNLIKRFVVMMLLPVRWMAAKVLIMILLFLTLLLSKLLVMMLMVRVERDGAILFAIVASSAILESPVHIVCSRNGVTVFHQYMMNNKITKDFYVKFLSI